MSIDLSFALTPDREHLRIELTRPVFQLDADGVSRLIEGLALWREKMLPATPSEPVVGSRVPVVRSPRWASMPDIEHGCSRLYLRHPGFGWLAFLLQIDDAQRLGQLLTMQAALNVDQPTSVN